MKMQMIRTLVGLMVLSAASAGLSDEPVRLRDAVECTPRQGLPNWFAKMADGGDVRIAYLGGSITAQPGWRVKTFDWFNMFMAGAGLEDTQHTVTVTLLAKPPEKAKILHSHRLPDLQKNPAKYADNFWYVGGILLIGEVGVPTSAVAAPSAVEPTVAVPDAAEPAKQ